MAVTEPQDSSVDEEHPDIEPADPVSAEKVKVRKRPGNDAVLLSSLSGLGSQHLERLVLDVAPAHRQLRELLSAWMEPAFIAAARRQQEQYADIARMAQGTLSPMVDRINQVARMVENANHLARTVEQLRAPLVPIPSVEAIKARYEELLAPLRRYSELEELVRMSSLTSTLTTAALGISQLDPALRSLLTANSTSLQHTLKVVSPASVRPDRSIQFATEAALTVATGGLVLAEPDEDDTFDSLLSDSRAELVARLDAVCPGASEQLLGAWERLDKPGPAAVSQAADSIVELVDRTLRALAPSQEVLHWHEAEGRSSDELHNDALTRRLRIVYIFRASGHPDRAAKAADHLIGLCQLAQGEKHTGTGTAGLVAVRLTLAGVEALLAFLFGI